MGHYRPTIINKPSLIRPKRLKVHRTETYSHAWYWQELVMQIEVKLLANLRKKLPLGSSRSKASLMLDEGATITTLIQQLDIPPNLAQMVLVNGEQTRE